MGLPIADTLVAIARRLVARMERRGEGVFTADRNHIHHRLLALGLDHRRAVLILYGVGVLGAGAAFTSMFLNTQNAALFVMAVLMAGLIGVRRLGYDEFALIRRGVVLKAFDFPVVSRSMFAVFADISMIAVAAAIAVGLNTDSWTPSVAGQATVSLAITMAPITIAVFWMSGLYRGSWRLAGVGDFLGAAKAVTITVVAGFLVYSLLWPGDYSASLLIVFGLVSFVILTGARASYVVLLSLQQRASMQGQPALVYGAGSRGLSAVNELYRDGSLGFRPIGFIDDNRERSGHSVHGLPILGSVRDLEAILRDKGAKALLVTTSKIRPDRLEHAAEICRRTGAGLFRARTLVERLGREHGTPSDSAPRTERALRPAEPAIATGSESLSAEVAAPALSPASGLSCGDCGSSKVFRSRTRTLIGRVHRAFTEKRPYRCRDCGWRGWVDPLEETGHVSLTAFEPENPDFGSLDQMISSHSLRERPFLAPRGLPH